MLQFYSKYINIKNSHEHLVVMNLHTQDEFRRTKQNMMKKIYTLLITFFIFGGAMGQLDDPCESCLPDGIHFTTQAQIDRVQYNYPGCTEIEGDVLTHISKSKTEIDISHPPAGIYFIKFWNDKYVMVQKVIKP